MILIVDDQAEVRDYITRILDRKGFKTATASNPADARKAIADLAQKLSLVILDLDLGVGPESGLDILTECKQQLPDLPVVILTGKGTIETAVRALKLGAQDFLEKDLYIEEQLGASIDRVQRFLAMVRENQKLESENEGLRRQAAFTVQLQRAKYQPVGVSEAFLSVLERAQRLASIPRPVLIRGERGSGKELIAATVHYGGTRRAKPFITVNCAAFSGQLLESEMFGHERGAFTGADKRKIGRFELADGGTLFLDEIGNMSPEFQEKLLRVVEYQEFQRVGGTATIKVDVRVIAATNADLEQLMDEGAFRRDLYDRLCFEVLWAPPLRERKEDIQPLVEHFATEFAAEVKLPPRRFTKPAMKVLCGYTWPGNIRELKNVVERLVFSAQSETIAATDLPDEITKGEAAPDPGNRFTERVTHLEHQILLDALAATGWNQKKAAEAIGLSYDQFRHFYRKHGLKKPE